MALRGPGIPPEDARHGTLPGFYAGCNEECCREAHNRYERSRRKRIELYGESGLRVDATGTHRRIESLFAMGWFAEEIARAMGRLDRNRVITIRKRKWVKPDTHESIKQVHELLYGKTPPPHYLRGRQKRRAIREGWVPAFAWDNIDDPREVPKGVLYEE